MSQQDPSQFYPQIPEDHRGTSASMLGLSYWVVPIFSAVVWTAMLITMLVYWAATGKPHYVTMSEGQNIPYISGKLSNMGS